MLQLQGDQQEHRGAGDQGGDEHPAQGRDASAEPGGSPDERGERGEPGSKDAASGQPSWAKALSARGQIEQDPCRGDDQLKAIKSPFFCLNNLHTHWQFYWPYVIAKL